MLVALMGCGDKFKYRDQYVGIFSITDQTPDGQGSQFHYDINQYQGAIYLGDDDQLVFQLYNSEAWTAAVDENGNLTGAPTIQRSGKFLNANSFTLSTVNSDYRITTTSGVRIGD